MIPILLIARALIFSWVAFPNAEPYPRKYRTSNVFVFCELDYGGKFVLKDEYTDEQGDG